MVISSREETVISLGITLSPVHITSMSGANFDPIVFRYSDVAIVGTALAVQYCVGQKRNFG